MSDIRRPARAFTSNSRTAMLPAFILGFGLSGFFDGILLHQILQWHHLLSLVPGEAFRDIGTQILADGLFHVLMYAITGYGLWLLWRRRPALHDSGTTWRLVAGAGLLGFGAWNVVDVGLFHWILSIHRIRVDVPDPLTYDLAWLAGLGATPLAIGWAFVRRPGTGGGAAAAAGLGSIAGLAALAAAQPRGDGETALVLIGRGASVPVINAAIAADARLVWADPEGRMIVISGSSADRDGALYGTGALYVTRSPILAGCVTTSRWS
jgi:uncharacterized membrane protein